MFSAPCISAAIRLKIKFCPAAAMSPAKKPEKTKTAADKKAAAASAASEAEQCEKALAEAGDLPLVMPRMHSRMRGQLPRRRWDLPLVMPRRHSRMRGQLPRRRPRTRKLRRCQRQQRQEQLLAFRRQLGVERCQRQQRQDQLLPLFRRHLGVGSCLRLEHLRPVQAPGQVTFVQGPRSCQQNPVMLGP